MRVGHHIPVKNKDVQVSVPVPTFTSTTPGFGFTLFSSTVSYFLGDDLMFSTFIVASTSIVGTGPGRGAANYCI